MSTRAPNLLILMSDQMGAPVLPIHGHPVCQAPHIEALADRGVVFDNAYCNYPLCAPARFSLLAGRLTPSIGAFDNASEFTADTPTLAHYLSLLGYRTILCGKMHFIGPDQLHGFEERLTTDVYPASFSFLPDWEKGPKWISSGTDLSSVVEAGPCLRSLQIDYDDEVEFFATQKLFDLARDAGDRPFFLCVSFTQPHSPYTPGQEHWDCYRHDHIDLPRTPEDSLWGAGRAEPGAVLGVRPRPAHGDGGRHPQRQARLLRNDQRDRRQGRPPAGVARGRRPAFRAGCADRFDETHEPIPTGRGGASGSTAPEIVGADCPGKPLPVRPRTCRAARTPLRTGAAYRPPGRTGERGRERGPDVGAQDGITTVVDGILGKVGADDRVNGRFANTDMPKLRALPDRGPVQARPSTV